MRHRGVQRSEARGRGVIVSESMQIRCSHETGRAAFFGFLHPETCFQIKCAFRCCIFRICVDGQPKQCNTYAFSQKSVFMWTAPNKTSKSIVFNGWILQYLSCNSLPCNTRSEKIRAHIHKDFYLSIRSTPQSD